LGKLYVILLERAGSKKKRKRANNVVPQKERLSYKGVKKTRTILEEGGVHNASRQSTSAGNLKSMRRLGHFIQKQEGKKRPSRG